MLITGATDGIGEGLARRLVEHGEDVIVHGRSAAKAEAAAERVGATATAVADLASFAQVRAMAADVAARFPRLDALVNNAGIGYGTTAPAAGARTEDGHDPTWQVNLLSGVLLTLGLHAPLAAARGRVVFVSSGLHAGAEIDLRAARRAAPDEPLRPLQARAGHGRARRWASAGRRTASTSTRAAPAGSPRRWAARRGAPLAQGVDTPFWLVTEPALAGTTGRYFSDRREQRPAAPVEDAAARSRLWDLIERSLA